MFNFVPEEKRVDQVPYFEDVTSTTGWAGHSTGKSEQELMSEIGMAVGRLGGIVNRWIPGSFGNRHGYRLMFTLNEGQHGRIDVVALPLKTKPSTKGYETKKTQAVKMALYNLRDQLESLWRMQQLIPGYFALLPLMLVDENRTVGQLWVEHLDAKNVLPATVGEDGDVIDGEYLEGE